MGFRSQRHGISGAVICVTCNRGFRKKLKMPSSTLNQEVMSDLDENCLHFTITFIGIR